ncbi:MAG TPA: HDIG domain-containing protein [Candidatus Sumerlaeota bacterium]|nr:HDIG domain-containing protein [Candidatus Sumerlaeota bacterium]
MPGVGTDNIFRRENKPRESQVMGSRTKFLVGRVGRWVALAMVFLSSLVLVNPGIVPDRVEWEQGQIARQRIVSRIVFSVVDEKALESTAKELREEKKQFFYTYDAKVTERMTKRILDIFEKARTIQADATVLSSNKSRALLTWASDEQKIVFHAPDVVASLVFRYCGDDLFLKTLSDGLKKPLETVVDDLKLYRSRYELKRVVVDSVPEDISIRLENLIDVNGVEQYLTTYFAHQKEVDKVLDREKQQLLILLCQAYVEPNIKFQPDETERQMKRNIEKLYSDPPRKSFKVGQILVEGGNVISEGQEELIRAMYKEIEHLNIRRFGAIALFMLVLLALVCYYIRQFRPELIFNTGTVLQVALPVLLALLFGHLALRVVDADRFPDVAGYAFPSAMIGMLAVILFDARSAVLLVTAGCLAFGVLTGLDFRVLLVSLFGGYMSVTVLRTAQARQEVLKVGFYVGLVNTVMIVLAHLMDDPLAIQWDSSGWGIVNNSQLVRWDLAGWGLVNGVFCGVVTMPTLVVFERLFGVVTDIGLLELTGLDHPLLKELEEKAAGSFQHSLNVCKLSEAAAKAIGANSLLVRAGSYFHDVGKILKPKYAGENAITLEERSLHSKLSPHMSAMIIKNHVKGGIELARKYKLPERVVDFIPQHHGTTIIAFFYVEALKRFENSRSMDPVRESDFRYPGPKPQMIETAIVMLADAVEATATSRFTSLSVNEDELRMCVHKIVTDKFADGQFDECDLTLRDLHVIRESFIKTLLGRFHHRVAYPSRPSRSGPAALVPKRDRLERD